MNENIYKRIDLKIDNLNLDLYFDKEIEKIWITKEAISKICNRPISTISRITSKKIIDKELVYGINILNFNMPNKKIFSLYDINALKILIKNEPIINKIEKFSTNYIDNYKKNVQSKIYFKRGKLLINEYSKKNNPLFISKDELIELFKIEDNTSLKNTAYYLKDIFKIGYSLNNQMGLEFRYWANSILTKALIDGFYIDNEKCINDKKKIIEITNIADYILEKEKLTDNEKEKYYKSLITFNNNIYDTEYFINDLLKSTQKQIIIISKYIDDSVYELLENIKTKITFYTSSKAIITKFMTNKFMKNHQLVVKRYYEINDTFIIINNTVYRFDTSIINLYKENIICEIIDIDYNSIINNLKKEKRLD